MKIYKQYWAVRKRETSNSTALEYNNVWVLFEVVKSRNKHSKNMLKMFGSTVHAIKRVNIAALVQWIVANFLSFLNPLAKNK